MVVPVWVEISQVSEGPPHTDQTPRIPESQDPVRTDNFSSLKNFVRSTKFLYAPNTRRTRCRLCRTGGVQSIGSISRPRGLMIRKHFRIRKSGFSNPLKLSAPNVTV